MADNTKDLEVLEKLFRSSTRPLSARKIAEKTKTYAATAKRRVEALIARGLKIKEVRHREGKRGPESQAWILR